MKRTEITLPLPPSVNGLYNGGQRSKRRFKEEGYERWIVEAGWVLRVQASKINLHTGPVRVVYNFGKPDNRKRDLFNMEKALSDLLVTHRVIADDSDIVEGTVRWAPGVQGVDVLIEDV